MYIEGGKEVFQFGRGGSIVVCWHHFLLSFDAMETQSGWKGILSFFVIIPFSFFGEILKCLSF